MKKLIILVNLLILFSSCIGQYCPRCKYELTNKTYIVDFDTSNRIPRFVYYTYQIGKEISGVSRPAFKTDERTEFSATPFDYMYSGYDKGHLFPYGSCESITACEECMLMTNITPQLPRFNRGVWSSIENFERLNAGPIAYIVTGTILLRSDKTIGNKVRVPTYFYKAIYNPRVGMIAFLCNQNKTDFQLISIDKLEVLTGIDFFYQLPDYLENKYESRFNESDWIWE